MIKFYPLLFIWTALFSNCVFATGITTITLPALDGIEITADTDIVHESSRSPLNVLLHQVGWNHGRCLETTPRAKMGFNCVVVNLHSGEIVNDF